MSSSVQINSDFISWCQNQTTHIAEPLRKKDKILDVIQRILVIISIIIPIIGLLFNCLESKLEKSNPQETSRPTFVPKRLTEERTFARQKPPASPRPKSLQSRATSLSHPAATRLQPLPAPALPFSLQRAPTSPRAQSMQRLVSSSVTQAQPLELRSFEPISTPKPLPRRLERLATPTRYEAQVSSRRQLASQLFSTNAKKV